MLGARNLDGPVCTLGDIAVLRLGNTAAGLRIVGRGLFPEFGDAGGLGNGVYMTFRGLKRMLPRGASERVPPPLPHRHRRPRARPRTCAGRSTRCRTRASGEPREVQALSDISGLPALLGGVLVAPRGGDARAHA